MHPYLKATQLKTKLPGYQVARSYAVNHQTLQSLSARHHDKFLKAFKYKQANVLTDFTVNKGVAACKYDGISGFFYWEQGQTPFIFHNTFGVEVGLPAATELATALEKAGHTSALLVGELSTVNKRSHSYDVISAINSPQKAEDLRNLQFVIFDVILLDRKDVQTNDYLTRINILKSLPVTQLAFIPEFKSIENLAELNAFLQSQLDIGHEGIVYHDLTMQVAWKIKPKFNIDLAIIGYVEGTDEQKGQVVSVMGALLHNDYYQLVARVGVANPALREPLFNELSRNHVPSNYTETDSDSRPIVWVKPTKTVEINAEAIAWEDTKGEPCTSAVLRIDANSLLYQGEGRIAKLFHPTMERLREDKQVNLCTFNQLPESTFQLVQSGAPKQSQILCRDVYSKTIKGKKAVKKFVAWENVGATEGPRFVVHTVDFSAGRGEPLKEDTQVTNSNEELLKFIQTWKEEEITKGWISEIKS